MTVVKKTKRNRMKFYSIMVVSILLITIGLGVVGYYAYQYFAPVAEGAQIANLADEVGQDTTSLLPDGSIDVSPINKDKLAEKAPNASAWLKVAGTNVNNPVAIPPSDDEWTYLNHDIWGNYAQAGTLFLDRLTPLSSKARIVYGHKMNARIMFHDIGDKADQDNFNNLGILTWWDKENGTASYRPVAATRVQADDTDIRNVGSMDKDNLRQWELDFYKNATARSENYNLGLIDGDREVIFLVTCSGYAEYGHDARTIVMYQKI